MDFSFFMPVEIIFGRNKLNEIGNLIQNKEVLIVSDQTFKNNGLVDLLKKTAGSQYTIYNFCEVQPNPCCTIVNKGAEYAREIKARTIIGLGGGSVIDSAKAIACMLESKDELQEYLFNGKQIPQRRTQLIAIPTTSGTGSEVTNVGVYTDKKRGQKKPLVSKSFWPDIALVDPQVTLSMPSRVTASTSLDALTHALESYWADSSQPMSKLLSMESMKLILENIENAVNSPEDYKAREKLMYASLIAGISFSQTRTTVLHALSFPLTNDYGLAHGFACAIAMPQVILDNYDYFQTEMDILLKYLGLTSVQQFSEKIKSIMLNIKAPVELKSLGIRKDDIDLIAEKTLTAPIAMLNPKKYSKEELIKMLNKIY